MADLLFLAILTAFFGICVLFVKACDRMIEHSDTVVADLGLEPELEDAA